MFSVSFDGFMVQSHEAETLNPFKVLPRGSKSYTFILFLLTQSWCDEPLKIIPVLDILDGIVVHAVRGRRKEYKPLESVLCTSTDPLEVASTFKKLGFDEIYMADLNAITNNQDNSAIIECIARKTGAHLMVDAGIADIAKAKTLMQLGTSKVIIGTETLTNLCFVKQAIASIGPDHVIVSFDMKNGQLLCKLDASKFADPIDLLCEFQSMGLTQVILLDLARVGSEEGVDSVFLKKVLDKVKLHVFVGGGVRDIEDLIVLKELGVAGVLVATALHSGKITVEQIQKAGLSLT